MLLSRGPVCNRKLRRTNRRRRTALVLCAGDQAPKPPADCQSSLCDHVNPALHARPSFGCGCLVISKCAKVGDRETALDEGREVGSLVSESQLLNDSKIWGAETGRGPCATGDLQIKNREMAAGQVVA